VNSAIDAVISAWSDFYAAKKDYQVTLPSQLLDLESTAKEVSSSYTVRTFVDDVAGESQVLWTY
jgi:hypothetical protein